MQSSAKTVAAYLASLPADRRDALNAIRKVILANLDEGYEEGMQYGMIGYFVPHSVYPAGYHCDPRQPLPFVSVASQKNYMALYMFCIYIDDAERDRFIKTWKNSGKRLDMGKACIRFKSIDDVPLDLIGEAVARVPSRKFIAAMEKYARPRPAAKSKAAARAVKPAGSRAAKPRAAKRSKASSRRAARSTR